MNGNATVIGDIANIMYIVQRYSEDTQGEKNENYINCTIFNTWSFVQTTRYTWIAYFLDYNVITHYYNIIVIGCRRWYIMEFIR